MYVVVDTFYLLASNFRFTRENEPVFFSQNRLKHVVNHSLGNGKSNQESENNAANRRTTTFTDLYQFGWRKGFRFFYHFGCA